MWGNGEVEEDLCPGFSIGFCCDGCVWAFDVEIHRLYGMTGGKELRSHLIDEHGLAHPPGKPRGVMSPKCFARFKSIADALVKAFTLG